MGKRTKAACGEVEVSSVWGEDAIDFLYSFYTKSSLRQFITVCKYAIEKAWKSDSDIVSGSTVRDAIIEATYHIR